MVKLFFKKASVLKTGVSRTNKSRPVVIPGAAREQGAGRQRTREIPRPALRLPFPHACAKGRRTLSRAGQAGLRKTYAEPTALSGNPRRGFPAKSLPPEVFSTLLRLPKATKAVGLCPTPRKPFEKGLSENFTCLHRTQARAACQPPPANPGAFKRRSRLPPRVLSASGRRPAPTEVAT